MCGWHWVSMIVVCLFVRSFMISLILLTDYPPHSYPLSIALGFLQCRFLPFAPMDPQLHHHRIEQLTCEEVVVHVIHRSHPLSKEISCILHTYISRKGQQRWRGWKQMG